MDAQKNIKFGPRIWLYNFSRHVGNWLSICAT